MSDDMNDDTNETTNYRTRPRKKKPIWLMILFPLLITALPLWFIFIGPQVRHDRLVEKGIHAPGRLLDLDETGTQHHAAREPAERSDTERSGEW